MSAFGESHIRFFERAGLTCLKGPLAVLRWYSTSVVPLPLSTLKDRGSRVSSEKDGGAAILHRKREGMTVPALYSHST